MSIPGLEAWLASALGRTVADWEKATVDAALADVFGFHALQLGLPQCELLRARRIPLRQRAGDSGPVDVLCDLMALPFAGQSIDLVVLPHVLEFADDPHQILREVERILMPEGRLLVVGFNPRSLWGLHRRLHADQSFPWGGSYLSLSRLRDWLHLLGFEIGDCDLGIYRPPCVQPRWLQRWQFMERLGHRWWSFAGGIYVLQAIKRTHAMRLIAPNWRRHPARGKALRPLPQKIAHKEGHGH